MRSSPLLSWFATLTVVLVACGAPAEEPASSRAKPNLDELALLKARPLACERDSQCPAGSHCDRDRERCDWQCFGDSDCGDPSLACTSRGSCAPAAAVRRDRIGTVSSALAADTSQCQAVPLPTRLAALDQLETDPIVCFDDSNCPCGAYCDNDATCRFDCKFDDPGAPPFCEPGRECSPEGRCLTSSQDDDPQIVADLQVSPTSLTADTAGAAVLRPVEVRIRAKLLSQVTIAQQVTLGVQVSDGAVAGPAAQVRCAESAPLAASCELGAGWQFGADPDPQRSSPRTIWVELPQGITPNEWTVTVRSEWSDAPVSLAVSAQPVIEPPHETGAFAGDLAWPQAQGAPIDLPVTAEITATHVVLWEPSRLLLPAGLAIFARDPSKATTVTWLRSDHPNAFPSQLEAVIDLTALTFSPDDEAYDATFALALGNGQGPIELVTRLRYQGPGTLSSCSNGCAAEETCYVGPNLCVPGPSADFAISADSAPLPTTLPSALRESWRGPLTTLRNQYNSLFGGEDVVAMERATCFGSPAQPAAAFFGGDNSTPSLAAKCADGTSQDVFPYLDRTTATVVDPFGAETFNLLDTCLAELAVAPSGSTPTSLLPQRQCVSVARYFLANTANTQTAVLQPAARQVQNQLSRQWAMLHTMIARSAVREAEYDEAVLGQSGEATNARLGLVADTVERGHRVLLRGQRTDSAEAAAAQAPDDRPLGRPLLHWTFNQNLDGPIDDVENPEGADYDLRVTNLPSSQRAAKYLNISSNSGTTCTTDRDVTLPARHFSLSAYVGVGNPPAGYTLLEKVTAWEAFRVRVVTPGDRRRVEVLSQQRTVSGSFVTVAGAYFDIPAEAGFYALVVDGNRYTLQHVRRNTSNGTPIVAEYQPYSITGGGPAFGPAGRISLGCNVTQGLVMIDEVALWARPISIDRLRVAATEVTPGQSGPYLTSGNAMTAAVVTLPPRALTLQATDEQAIGLGTHLLDSAAASMELLTAYLRAERRDLYAECGVGVSGAAHQRVLGRAGRLMRLSVLLENDAADSQTLAGNPPAWQERYDASSRLLAGRRAEAVRELALATSCRNPLGIDDDDLPLFHGHAVDTSARFFASSRFLTGKAREEINSANGELEAARAAWLAQRTSSFQNAVLGPSEKQERLRKIENEYEGVLRRLCGVPAGGTILGGFRDGTLTMANCFIKSEVTGCGNAASLPLGKIPATCLRGQLGEQIMAIGAAEIDARNAEKAYDRAIARYDSEMMFCTSRAEFYEENQRIRQEHAAALAKIRSRRRTLGLMSSVLGAVVSFAVPFVSPQQRDGSGNLIPKFGPLQALNFAASLAGIVMGQQEQKLEEEEQREKEAHERVMAARAEAAALATCFHEADNQKFAIAAAADIITRAYHDTKATFVRLDNLQSEVTAVVDQAIGDLELEAALVRVLPHHHYWLDDHIDAYRRHLAYAQRLTYLAVVALEYESQQSFSLRGTVLGARVPSQLLAVVTAVEARHAPLEGSAAVGEFAPVLSVRDEILRLGTAAAPPGFPPLTPKEALRAYLRSDASKITYNGQYLGRGLRFALRPPAWAQFSCAERIWRVTASLQVDTAPINNAQLVLWQENAFASQRCGTIPAELRATRIRPFTNVLTGENATFGSHSQYTSLLLSGLGNVSRNDLERLPEGQHSGLAGRGLFGNYVLLFPAGQFDNETFLSNVADVLLRFDLVQVANAGSPQP